MENLGTRVRKLHLLLSLSLCELKTRASMSEYPYSTARSAQSSSESDALLASILAASTLDEISNAEDFASVEDYIRNQGRVDGSGKTTLGLMFWLYPTGMRGPFHESREEEIELHGTLITIERGASLTDAVAKAREGLRLRGIGHLHIANQTRDQKHD